MKTLILAIVLTVSMQARAKFEEPYHLPPGMSICEVKLVPELDEEEDANTGVEAQDFYGKFVGRFYAHSCLDGLDLSNIETHVDFKFRNRGICSAMAASFFAMHPEAQTVKATLVARNFEAYSSAFRRTRSKRKAIRETPFYKVVAPHGFTKIEVIDHLIEGLYVELSKENLKLKTQEKK